MFKGETVTLTIYISLLLPNNLVIVCSNRFVFN